MYSMVQCFQHEWQSGSAMCNEHIRTFIRKKKWKSNYLLHYICSWTYFYIFSADYIKACSRSDPKFDECAFQSARASLKRFARGDKERNIPELDPLKVKEIRAIGNNNQNGLNVIFTDCKLTGCANLDLIKFKYVLHALLAKFTITVTNGTHSVWKLCSQCGNGEKCWARFEISKGALTQYKSKRTSLY